MEDVNTKERLLIYIQVPFRRNPNGELLVETQAANGLRRWAEHFPKVTVMAPIDERGGDDGYTSLSALGEAENQLELVPLPTAYRPDQFVKALPSVRRLIREKIEGSRWLCFAIGGLFGDWGSVAAIQANAMDRKFAVWTDKVESEVTRKLGETGTGKAAIRARLTHRPMALLERYVIKRSSLGLFHGRETFDAYCGMSLQPELVHNIHLQRSDQIPEGDLEKKADEAGSGPLRILYAGRIEAEKGPDDWISTLHLLRQRGVDFEARWIGSGSLGETFQRRLSECGLSKFVSVPGQIFDRKEVLANYRWSNIFMFCHLTAESPRCLIEALKSGTPIVGYDSAYPRDLIEKNGGGLLISRGNVEGLANSLSRLDADRVALGHLIRAAAADGLPFDDESVFRHRSELIKSFV